MATPTFTKYNGMIADPDLQTRMRLKQATASVVQFGEVIQIGHLNEAIGRLDEGKRWDVIFISHHYTDEEVAKFIARAKELKGGQDTAFIQVMKNSDQKNAAIAQAMMRGADGFLFEPYSVDQLIEITDLSARIKRERSDMRESLAMTLILGDIMTQLDLVAFLKASGFEVTRSATRLKELCASLKGSATTPENLARYHGIALKLFVEAPLPKPMFQAQKYAGVSSRVKKKMEEKIIAEVEKEMKSTAGGKA
jgi:CheY-like chemotaxis protein